MARNGWAGACALIVLAASIAGCAGVETEPPRPTIGLDPDDRDAAAQRIVDRRHEIGDRAARPQRGRYAARATSSRAQRTWYHDPP